MELQHVESGFAQSLGDIIASRIHENSRDETSPGNCVANFARTFDADVAGARWMEIDPDYLRAQCGRNFGVFRARHAADFHTHAHAIFEPPRRRTTARGPTTPRADCPRAAGSRLSETRAHLRHRACECRRAFRSRSPRR